MRAAVDAGIKARSKAYVREWERQTGMRFPRTGGCVRGGERRLKSEKLHGSAGAAKSRTTARKGPPVR